MVQLKRCIVEVKEEENSLAHALVIAIAKVDKDPNYDAFVKAGRYAKRSNSRLPA